MASMEVEQEDWRVGRSLLHRIQYMFDTHYATDVVFKVGPNRRQMKAHKVFLIAGSPVFDAMLSRWNDDADFIVDDVEPDVFHEMLTYVTYDEVNITGENVLDLLYVAHKYLITGLIAKCDKYLQKNLGVKNVCVVLSHAIKYEANDLKAKCMDLMSCSAQAVVESEEFLTLSSSALDTFLALDTMNMNSEIEVYQACLRWADEKCWEDRIEVTDANRRAVLGPLIWKIRFPTMSVADFAEVTRTSELLTPAEKIAIFQHIGLKQHPESGEKTLVSVEPFVCRPRNSTNAQILKRFRTKSGFPGMSCSPASEHVIDFETDEDIVILGFGIYGNSQNASNQPIVQVQILGERQRVMSDTGDVYLAAECKPDPIQILLPTPLHIEANARYSIVMTPLQRFTSYSGKEGNEKVKVSDCTFFFYRNRSATSNQNTSVKQGQIPEIIFRV